MCSVGAVTQNTIRFNKMSSEEKKRFAKDMHDCRVFLQTGSYPKGYSEVEKRTLRHMRKRFVIDEDGKLVTRREGKEVLTEQKEQEEKIKQQHEGGSDGIHLGRDRTAQKVSARFYWKGIWNDVTTWIHKCDNCQRCKKRPKRPKKPTTPLSSIPVTGIWKHVGLDLLGPFPTTRKGNKYVITLCDFFSKWPEAVAVPEISTDAVVNFLWEMMMRMGFVKVIFTIQGGEFDTLLNASMLKIWNIEHRNATSTNELDEPLNKTLQASLTKVVNKDGGDDWDDHLNKILFEYRTSVHPITKFSPFVVMYGREPTMFTDLKISSSSSSEPEFPENCGEMMKNEQSA